MVYARKKHGGASCYLIAPDSVADFIREEKYGEEWELSKANPTY